MRAALDFCGVGSGKQCVDHRQQVGTAGQQAAGVVQADAANGGERQAEAAARLLQQFEAWRLGAPGLVCELKKRPKAR